ncbi:hypothetical protein Tco_0532024 [Tanacetum coccineum]
MAKPILNKAREQNLAEPRDECNEEFEFSKELLTELQNNTFNGRPFSTPHESLPSLTFEGRKKWWMNEGDGNISTWEELVKKFFYKFYPISCASNYDNMCDDDEEGCDPLEFIPWRNSNFKDHKKVDETTKRALLYTWIEIGKEEGLLNDKVSSDKEWEKREYGNPPNDSFPKPYLNINHHNENNGDADKSSGMDLSGAPQSENISNEQPTKEYAE